MQHFKSRLSIVLVAILCGLIGACVFLLLIIRPSINSPGAIKERERAESPSRGERASTTRTTTRKVAEASGTDRAKEAASKAEPKAWLVPQEYQHEISGSSDPRRPGGEATAVPTLTPTLEPMSEGKEMSEEEQDENDTLGEEAFDSLRDDIDDLTER